MTPEARGRGWGRLLSASPKRLPAQCLPETVAFEDLVDPGAYPGGPEVVATRGIAARDPDGLRHAVRRVLRARSRGRRWAGRIGLHAIATARRMIVTGQWAREGRRRISIASTPERRPSPRGAPCGLAPGCHRASCQGSRCRSGGRARHHHGGVGLRSRGPFTGRGNRLDAADADDGPRAACGSARSRGERGGRGPLPSPGCSSGSAGSSWRWWRTTRDPASPSGISAARQSCTTRPREYVRTVLGESRPARVTERQASRAGMVGAAADAYTSNAHDTHGWVSARPVRPAVLPRLGRHGRSLEGLKEGEQMTHPDRTLPHVRDRDMRRVAIEGVPAGCRLRWRDADLRRRIRVGGHVVLAFARGEESTP